MSSFSYHATYLSEHNTSQLDDPTTHSDWTHKRTASINSDGTIDVVDTINLWYDAEKGMHGVKVVKWQTNMDDYGRMVEAAEQRFRATNNHNFWHNWQADLKIYKRLSQYAIVLRKRAEILAEHPNTRWLPNYRLTEDGVEFF